MAVSGATWLLVVEDISEEEDWKKDSTSSCPVFSKNCNLDNFLLREIPLLFGFFGAGGQV